MRAYLADGSYCLAVRDQGPGIPREDRERIFEVFYTTKPPGRGSGMGLAISRSIVEMHKGTVMLGCDEEGTTFVVSIPLREEGEECTA